jgi:hypothetical protein
MKNLKVGKLKAAEVSLRKGLGKREHNGGGTKPGYTVCIYGNITMKPLYNYRILTKA